MADTTETNDGSIDAVAASLLIEPEREQKNTEAEVEETAAEDIAADDTADEPEADAEAVDDAEEADGEQTDETDEEADAEETAELYPVKVDGKTEMRTLDELKRAYSGQGYIQQRMQETAAIRKEAEAVFNALAQERAQLSAFVDQLRTGQLPLQAPTPPSRELLERDPIGYIEAQAKFQEDAAAYQNTAAALQQQMAMQQEMNERARNATLQEQMALLSQALPDFADPDKAVATRDRIVKTAVDAYGFDPSELMGVTDHRHVRVLHDAMLYRQLMAERGKVEQKVQKQARPFVKPGVKKPGNEGQVKKAEKARAQMKRTGSVDDIARFLLS